MTTYYVDPVSGNNINGGTSFGLAWATTQHAFDNATSGDTVLLCNTGTESVATQIDMDTAAGGSSLQIHFAAADSSGNEDDTETYTLQATAAITAILRLTTGGGGLQMRGVVFDGNSNATYCIHQDAFINASSFSRCEITGATADGARLVNITHVHFTDCNIHTNGAIGVNGSTGSRGIFSLHGCRVHDNTSDGIWTGRGPTSIVQCEVYDNGGNGITLGNGGEYCTIANCTIDRNDGDGINNDSGTVWHRVTGCAITNSGGHGIATNSAGTVYDRMSVVEYNLFYSNTSGDHEASTGVPGDRKNITGSDPLYTTTTDGSEDYTPGSGSPLISAGVNSTTIGAKCPSSGGSTVAIVNRRTNSLTLR